MLTIYVNNHEIHVENYQECHFTKNKKNPTSTNNQDILLGGYWGIGGRVGYWGEYIIN